MARVQIYLTAQCGFCRAALRLLEAKGVTDLDAVRVDLDPARRVEMQQRSGRRTVPQIWIDGRHVGGFEDLQELDLAGELDERLATEKT